MGLLDRIRIAKPESLATPKGRSGTVNTAGFLEETESNPQLVWPQNLTLYDLMRRTDPTMRWMISLVTTPIRAADWRVEPAGNSDEDREIAAFVEHCLFEQLTWDNVLRDILLYLPYGHSVMEQVVDFRTVKFSFDDESGETVEQERNAFVYSALAPRLPRTIVEWHPDPKDPGKLGYIVQQLYDGNGPSQVKIPAERLVVFTHEREGDDWRGHSILRSAWRSWDYKVKLERLEAIAYERSVGLPVVYPPANATEEQLASVEQGVMRLRQGETAYLMMPGPKQTADQGWIVEPFRVDGETKDPGQAIQRHENNVARNVLAEFMRLGHEGGGGARATGDVQQDPYYQGIHAHVEYIRDILDERVIAPLVAWNFGEDKTSPKIEATKIRRRDIAMLSGALSQLKSAQILTGDFELEQWARDLIDAPRKKAEALDDPNYKPAVPPALEGMNGSGLEPEPLEFRSGAPSNGAGNGAGKGAADPRRFGLRKETEPVRLAERPTLPEEQFIDKERLARATESNEEKIEKRVVEAADKQIDLLLLQMENAVRTRDLDALEKIGVEASAFAGPIAQVLEDVYRTGQSTVREELRRQGDADPFA